MIESLGGAVRRGRETNEQEARTGIAEAEHGLASVHLVFERAPFLARDAIAVLAQPGTLLARDDRVAHVSEAGPAEAGRSAEAGGGPVEQTTA